MKTLNKLDLIQDNYLKEVVGGITGNGNELVQLETTGRRGHDIGKAFEFPAQDVALTNKLLAYVGLTLVPTKVVF